MIKGGVLHYFSKKATVVVSLSSHLFGPENNCSPSNVRQSILFCPRAFREQRKNVQTAAGKHPPKILFSLPKNSFRWEVQGKWKLNVLINKTLLHVDRYFITVRSNTFHLKRTIQSETAWLENCYALTKLSWRRYPKFSYFDIPKLLRN